jgi:hypothetical protein
MQPDIAFVFSLLRHPTPKNPSKLLSSPHRPPKLFNSIKTKQIKVENNWRTSYGPFGKIEL